MALAQPAYAGRPDIPVIDLGSARAGAPAANERAAREIAAALDTIGFFAIANHGVPHSVTDNALAFARAFFALPAERKLAVRISAAHRGYMPMGDQHRVEAKRPNLSESFLVGPELAPDDPDVLAGRPLHGPNQWPPHPAFLRLALEAHFEAMTGLGQELVELFDQALDVPAGFFRSRFKKPMAFIRALHYPPAPEPCPPDLFGAAPHSDFGFLTIVAQDDIGGLQVRRRDGTWIDAPCRPGLFLVNIGDMLMRWTNDRFVSTQHRVLNPKGSHRYSLAFFFDPDFETIVECLPSCRSADNPPRYPPASWGEFLAARFDAQHAYRKGQPA